MCEKIGVVVVSNYLVVWELLLDFWRFFCDYWRIGEVCVVWCGSGNVFLWVVWRLFCGDCWIGIVSLLIGMCICGRE